MSAQPEDLEVLSDLEGLTPRYTYELLKKDIYRRFIDQYLIDLDAQKAGRRCGFRTPNTAHTLMHREDVRAVIDQRLAERSYRVQVTADDVLLELWETVLELKTADLKDVLDANGSVRPIEDWPEVWRKGLVVGMDVEDTYERSKDGVVAGESKAWDKSGRISKIKVVDRMKLRATYLELLGRHVNVKAFEEKATVEIHLHAEIDRKIAAGRQRAARIIEAIPVSLGAKNGKNP